MRKTNVAALAVVLCVLVGTSFGAAIDADDYADGTNIGTIVPGVTITASGNLTDGPSVFAANADDSPTSEQNLAYENGGDKRATAISGVFNAMFTVTFDDSISQFSAEAIGNALDNTSVAILMAYDIGNNLIDTATSSALNYGEKTTLSIIDPSMEIAYVTLSANSSGAVYAGFSYTTSTIPTPAALPAGLGMLGLMATRRRHR